jgi:hypothetical protein
MCGGWRADIHQRVLQVRERVKKYFACKLFPIGLLSFSEQATCDMLEKKAVEVEE